MRTFVSCMHLYTHDALNFSWFPFFLPFIDFAIHCREEKQTNKQNRTNEKKKRIRHWSERALCWSYLFSLCCFFFVFKSAEVR